jgi:hypothetical protein
MRVSTMNSAIEHRRWSRPVVGIGVVVVLSAGLGAVFGIRAVVGDGAAPSAGQPPARTGAAMAYDVADQSIVLFGGESRSRSLDDTWTWDGSAWTQANPATSPPALDDPQMAYDPVSHDVILIGEQEAAGSNGEPIACAVGGSGSSSSSGSTSSGSSGSAPGSIPPGTPIPDIAPLPSATSSAKGGTARAPSSCTTIVSPKEATWLWNGTDWSRASGSTPLIGFGSGSLATDPVAGRVVLLTSGPFAEPAIACPIASPLHPNAQPMCPYFPVVAPAWTWNGHAWTEITSKPSTSSDLIGSSIVVDAITGKLATFSGGEFIAPTPTSPTCEGCVSGAPVPVPPSASGPRPQSLWDGSAWKQVATYKQGPETSGLTFVGDPSTHSDVVLTGDGQTWIWTGVWKQVHPATTPPIVSSAASAYDAATGQVVMFGGYGATSRETGLYDQTWTWDGANWTQRGGASGPSVTIPVPSPVRVPPGLPCEPVTAPNQPVSGASVEPQAICNETTGGGSGSTGGVTGIASGSGAAAP